MIRSPNLLFVFAALRHFASSPNQSEAWRMHVRISILVAFLRPADPPTDAADRHDHEPGDGANPSGIDYSLI